MKLIFKHSFRCPISARAKIEVEKYLNRKPNNVDFEFIDVIEQREVSLRIAETYGIRHESPQVLLINDQNQCLWNASHYEITESHIEKSVNHFLNRQ